MEQTKTISLFSSEELSKSKDKREEFFVQVFNLYYKRIFNYTYYRINVKDDAEYLTSQIFQKVISKINTFNKDKAEFEIWLFAIARNTVNDYLSIFQKDMNLKKQFFIRIRREVLIIRIL